MAANVPCSPRTLTALQAELLLHFYYTPMPPQINGRATEEGINYLLEMGLLGLCVELERDPVYPPYTVTDKGKCLVEAMLSLPMPVNDWRMP